MRYASLRSMDISNGEGIGVALFTQGCPFHCYNCFNPQTWAFDSGFEWNDALNKKVISLVQKNYITRFSVLGGEPLVQSTDVKEIITLVKTARPDIKVWLYTGFEFENLTEEQLECVKLCDVLIDGQFVDSLKDYRLSFRGSSNQRIIDVQATLNKGEIKLCCY